MKAKEISLIESRYNGFVDQIEHYLWLYFDEKHLSKEQIEHLKELKNTIVVFGERANLLIGEVNELLATFN